MQSHLASAKSLAVTLGLALLSEAFFFLTTTAFAATVPGLVAAYSFDEGSGALVNDLSGNGHSGSVSNATWTTQGHTLGALSFNGASAWVTVADASDLRLSTAMTLEVWANPLSLSGWRSVILKERPSGLSYALYESDDTNRPPAVYGNTGGDDVAATGSAPLPLNTWSHLAATYDGATLRLYVNGALVKSQALSGALAASTLPLRIGGNAVWGEYFAGLIDDVRIYSRVLSAAEIQTDMATPVASAPPLPLPPPSSEIGQWSSPIELGLVAVNLVQLHTGKILMYRGENSGGTSATVWNPTAGTFKSVPAPYNVFCSGHAALADGRILIVGGHDNDHGILGSNQAAIFDPVTESWTSVPPMSYRRWYPTATTLADGRVLVTSGGTTCFECIADIPEIYDPQTNNWTQLGGAQLAFPYYPFIFLLPDGRILNAGAGEQPTVARTLDLGTQQWTTLDPTVVDGGSAAMFRPGKVLKSGTAATTDVSNLPSAPTTYVLDTTKPSPAWRQTAPMAFPRAYHTLTVLPDGNILATGGGVTTEGKNTSAAVYEAELWTPATETWKTLAAMQTPRLYHSTALLLPDGRVAVAGSGDSYGGPNQTKAEFYSPPYLFKGTRPQVASTPSVIPYGSTFSIGLANTATIRSVVLIRPGAVTHQFDENQRYVELSFSQNGTGLTASAPANGNLAPPGYYMLFLVDANGVPSTAAWVRLQAAADATLPTVAIIAPIQGATVSGSVNLAATASDNIAVTGVQFLLDGQPLGGLVPGPSNPYQLAWDTRTTANENHTLSARALDAAGNVGTAANVTVTVSNAASQGLNTDKVVFKDGRGNIATPTFSTSGPNEWLLAFIASDGPTSGGQSVTVSGAGLSWTLVRRTNTRLGTAEVWKAFASAALTNIAVQSVQTQGGYDQSITVVALTGASGIGASAGAFGQSGTPTVTLATTAANAWVFAVGNDWDKAIARTLGAGQTMVHQWVDTPTGDTMWIQRLNGAVVAPGTTVTINDTAPTTDQWNLTAVEILPN